MTRHDVTAVVGWCLVFLVITWAVLTGLLLVLKSLLWMIEAIL